MTRINRYPHDSPTVRSAQGVSCPGTNERFRREQLPSPQSFYRDELGKLSRQSRGWCRTVCPFHKGKNQTAFSVNLSNGGFHCFNCGVKGGSIVDFLMLRDSLTFKEAAQSLGAWDDVTSFTWAQTRQFKKDRERRQADAIAKIESERRQRIEARDSLHSLERIYARAGRRLTEISKGASESFAGEGEICWSIMASALPLIRFADVEYREVAGVHICQ